MASSLAVKRFLSSGLLSSRSFLLRPVASVSRSLNTNAMRQYDEHSDDRNIDVDRRSFPRTTARRDDLFSGSCYRSFSPHPFSSIPIPIPIFILLY